MINHYNSSGKEFKKVDKDVMRITGEQIEIEALYIEKTQNDE